MLRVGLIGYGYWGKNLLRNLMTNNKIEVVGVLDDAEEALTKLEKDYPQVSKIKNFHSLLNEKPDAIVIATPPSSHFELAQQCLEHNLHLMIEKPMALSSVDCERLNSLAENKNKVLMIDHTYVFQPAIKQLKNLIDDNGLGNLLYYNSERVNLGGFQPEVNVLWDLAPHDLSILDYLLDGKSPCKVFATGAKHFGTDVESLCYATLHYKNGFIAHLHLNWAAPVKSRKIMIGGDKKMIIYDDNQPSEKIKIYDQTVELQDTSRQEFTVNYRVGKMYSPVIPQHEPLAEAITEFVEQIHTGRKGRSDGNLGLRIVKTLEALTKSLESGKPVIL